MWNQGQVHEGGSPLGNFSVIFLESVLKHCFPRWSVLYLPINCVCLGPRHCKRGSGQKFQIRSKSGNKKLASVLLKAPIIRVTKKIFGVICSKTWSHICEPVPVLVGEASRSSLVDLVVAERGGRRRWRRICLCGNYSRSTWYLKKDLIKNISFLGVDMLPPGQSLALSHRNPSCEVSSTFFAALDLPSPLSQVPRPKRGLDWRRSFPRFLVWPSSPFPRSRPTSFQCHYFHPDPYFWASFFFVCASLPTLPLLPPLIFLLIPGFLVLHLHSLCLLFLK